MIQPVLVELGIGGAVYLNHVEACYQNRGSNKARPSQRKPRTEEQAQGTGTVVPLHLRFGSPQRMYIFLSHTLDFSVKTFRKITASPQNQRRPRYHQAISEVDKRRATRSSSNGPLLKSQEKGTVKDG